MKNLSIAFAAAVLAVLAGCTTTVTEPEVGVSSEALTQAECDAQRSACVAKNGLIGLLTICPAQHTTCIATASNGLPAQVVDAATAAAECAADLDDCVFAANTPSELAQCAEDEAACLADTLGVTLPSFDLGLTSVVDGVGECANSAADCIAAAKTESDLLACAESLTDCAVEVVDLGGTVGAVIDCTDGLDGCVSAATSATELTACGEEQALCVSAALEVPVPDLPVSEVVECAESAVDCTLAIESLRDVVDCSQSLLDCGTTVVEMAPPVVDCGAQWTACMLNPFNILKCNAELRACK